MPKRLFATIAASVLLAGCSSSDEPDPTKPAEGDEHIDCAVSGQADFAHVCAVERSYTGGGLTLIVRHPDGGFRRFKVQTDGSGLAVVDGADDAVSELSGNVLSVTVGPDRYRFPVTPKAKPDDAGQP